MNEHSLIYMTKLYNEAMDLNTKLQEELEFEKSTNIELLSTGAELENKLYEEQDKNKRLKKELQEEIEEKEHYQAIVESWE